MNSVWITRLVAMVGAGLWCLLHFLNTRFTALKRQIPLTAKRQAPASNARSGGKRAVPWNIQAPAFASVNS
ncbi:hypothetical protein Fbal_0399 [Ferrimonas balearica DSM 9799]|uniref:Uncharacterized protein n=1 Tax=Ferrimonas balearica (strain DSM 9799 / CCM 4581 / KCTC 23876 / PAT) TaxID=550540 RepID=E1SNB4_FERBD|nr:hypothetical protein Fbal_0399 [Ferrimonas balearica DSM 9799]